MSSEIYSEQFTVPASVIDERAHVNNLAYLKWCIEAAEAHWQQNASEAIRNKYVWYVLKHTIEYKAAAFEGEQLEVHTWVVSAEGVRSERHYKILRLSDDATLIRGKTVWCLLDAKTQRPTRITSEIRNLFL